MNRRIFRNPTGKGSENGFVENSLLVFKFMKMKTVYYMKNEDMNSKVVEKNLKEGCVLYDMTNVTINKNGLGSRV